MIRVLVIQFSLRRYIFRTAMFDLFWMTTILTILIVLDYPIPTKYLLEKQPLVIFDRWLKEVQWNKLINCDKVSH